jgi:hypothetical protein
MIMFPIFFTVSVQQKLMVCTRPSSALPIALSIELSDNIMNLPDGIEGTQNQNGKLAQETAFVAGQWKIGSGGPG